MSDISFMRLALRLAWRGLGTTSPNPTVGAVLVKGGRILGRGRTAPAGGPHAEIEAIRDAQSKKQNLKGATLFVTLEPCCTHGRTPPCTDAIIAAGIKKVVVAATDPNPVHAGRGFEILKRAGIEVEAFGVPRSRGSGDAAQPDRLKAELQTLAGEATRLNEAFNHWIVHRTPFVTVKSAMTLDGKIATARGESKWITGEKSRAHGMKLRQAADAILVGVNTIVADDPSLTIRLVQSPKPKVQGQKILRRIVLDPNARTPLSAKILNDEFAAWTTVVVTKAAAKNRVEKLLSKTNVLVALGRNGQIDLRWLLKKLGEENVTSLLVEGGGETNARFLEQKLVQRIAFFYAPKILCGRDSRKSVAGKGIERLEQKISLREVEWKKLGADLFLTARLESKL
ncbi:MAG: bifunctional diaminohydroxyphosphoribosylaminopyrimidine deaminase/5-amino-6-(5-phosphoribosylamino)uracil reductase RibD [Verrucomicrobiota bacterium]